MTSETDRIVRTVVLRATRSRVWQAISDSKQFGSWFGMRVDGPWRPGKAMRVAIMPTTVDADVAAMQKKFEGVEFDLLIEKVEPETLFSFRWHPFGIEAGVDYSKEEPTLVTFVLEDVPEGVRLTVTESGFDKIPLSRRAKAFAANEGGWGKQMELISKYLAYGA